MSHLKIGWLKGLPPIIEKTSEVIILGTFPGRNSLCENEYYANIDGNHFWEIISTLLQFDINSRYPDKISFLLDNKIALWDVIETCSRNKTSADSAIKDPTLNNLDALIEDYTNIQAIGFNGATAYYQYAISASSGFECLKIKDYFILPSSSKRNREPINEKIRGWYNKLSQYIDFNIPENGRTKK